MIGNAHTGCEVVLAASPFCFSGSVVREMVFNLKEESGDAWDCGPALAKPRDVNMVRNDPGPDFGMCALSSCPGVWSRK